MRALWQRLLLTLILSHQYSPQYTIRESAKAANCVRAIHTLVMRLLQYIPVFNIVIVLATNIDCRRLAALLCKKTFKASITSYGKRWDAK